MRNMLVSGLAGIALIAAAMPASAGLLSGDFKETLSLPDYSPHTRVLENIGEAVGGSPDLSAANETSNPNSYNGYADVDLSGSGLLTLTGNQEGKSYADYEIMVIEITNIVLDFGEFITGISLLSDNLVDMGSSATVGPYTVSTAYTANSLTIMYSSDGDGTEFEISDGGQATFRVDTDSLFGSTDVPVPAALPLLAGGIAGLALIARRKR